MAVGKIICIGDSLVRGDETNVAGHRSLRGPLQSLLASAGYTVDFIGREYSLPVGGTDGDHEGYGGARMDSSDDATNSIEGRVSAMRTAAGPVDIIVLYIGWNDVYNATASIATKYSDLLTTIRAGDWASAKLVLVTLHPEPNKTAAQTGSDYAEYALLNTQIRSEADTNHRVADLAALTTGNDRSALVETLIYDAQNAPDYTTTQGGWGPIPSAYGGHLVTSFKSMQDYCAQWTTNVAVREGPGGAGLVSPDSSSVGHPSFINGAQAIVPWLWMFAGPGNDSTNTVIESRNMFAQAWNGSTGSWEWLFQGARTGNDADNDVNRWNPPGQSSHALATSGSRGDGVTSWYRPYWNTGLEVWPRDTTPSRGISTFYGGFNRSAVANGVCFCWGVQVRLALLDSAGANDISRAVLFAKCGADYSAAQYPYHYDFYGWPWNVCDGGSDRWKRITSTEWVWIGGISIGSGTGGHWSDPGRPPPLYANWPSTTQFNDIPTYSKTATEVRANPPLLPAYYSGGTTGSTNAWTIADYWFNQSIGTQDIHWSQSGAEKAARTIYDTMVTAGWLSGFTGGGPIAPSVLPGIGNSSEWLLRWDNEGSAIAKWRNTTAATASAPVWITTALPPASVGVAYTFTLQAAGSPAPTFSHVSGKPSWMTIASNGAITGTPTGSATTHSIVIQASNASGNVNTTLALDVRAGPTITTTTLPGAVQGVAYNSGVIAVSGTGPFTYTLQSGTLPTGLSLVGAVIVGTPTGTGTSTFTIRAADAYGLSDDQELSIAVTATSNVTTITSTALPTGTINIAYSYTVTATGSTPRTWTATGLPPGLNINGTSGAITGTPTSYGVFYVAVTASHTTAGTDTETFPLVIQSAAATTVASPWGRFLSP
jgi:GDSL-like Lipase/Acylhydrolase family/Putative Ig domain